MSHKFYWLLQDGMGTLLNLRLEFQQNEDETEQESEKGKIQYLKKLFNI